MENMKFNPALLLLLAATATFSHAEAQSAKRTPARRTTTAVRKPAAAACDDLPTLGAAIPKVEGCPKPLYSLRYIDTLVGTGTP